ncbi:MAG: hypothetical protein D6698_14135 [Gammaproteobacteria bacterium]|nr:MAG: hypothetical protein D6698_14135 [Gammaproteobacteria bacterium]
MSLKSDKLHGKWLVFMLLVLAICCAQASYVHAETNPGEGSKSSHAASVHELLGSGDLQFHGFVSQGFIYTSRNDVFGTSQDWGSFGLTEIGLNLLLKPTSRLQFSAQELFRRAGEGSSGDPRIDFAFVDYRLLSRVASQFGIRAGRIKNPFGFYNETRDVPFTRPSILLPQSIYFDRTRNVALSADSLQIYGEQIITGMGSISAQFGVGQPIVNDKDTEVSLLGMLRPGHLSPDMTLLGRLIYETEDQAFRTALSGIWMNINYDRAAVDTLASGSIDFNPLYLSVQYNAERWSLTSEYALRRFRYMGFSDPFLDSLDFSGESIYLQGEYRLNAKWQAMARYDLLYTDRNDRSGKRFSGRFAVPDYSRFAKDATVGISWNLTPEFMLRGEYHFINGTAWLSPLDNPVSASTRQYWSLYALQVSYRF